MQLNQKSHRWQSATHRQPSQRISFRADCQHVIQVSVTSEGRSDSRRRGLQCTHLVTMAVPCRWQKTWFPGIPPLTQDLCFSLFSHYLNQIAVCHTCLLNKRKNIYLNRKKFLAASKGSSSVIIVKETKTRTKMIRQSFRKTRTIK